jgi:hypothetical protein
MTNLRILAGVTLLAAAVGIGVQIAGGADYPVVPPGAVILVTAGLLVLLWRRWWTPLIAAGLAAFLCVGAVLASGVADHLREPATSAVFLGTVLQLVTMVIGLVASVLTAVADRRAARTRPAVLDRERRA